MTFKVLFSNIGYAKGIDGSLGQHLRHFHRHVHCPLPVQQQVLMQIKSVIAEENPDLCCFVEIEHDDARPERFSQLMGLAGGAYPHFDATDKYGINSWLSRMPWHRGRCNAFLARQLLPFERHYFSFGSKRLIYEINHPEKDLTVYFAHFSLQRAVRAEQFKEMRRLLARREKPAVIMADFNIMSGFAELGPLLQGNDLRVISREDEPTFMFHTWRRTLDLCICSESLVERASLKIIPQPYSDHAALLLQID